jgi:radical SAM superfamily enzyme YgiQ (UPF0313 family)
MVWPKFPASFWGFEAVLKMLPESAITPPLGLITLAALCPDHWTIRLIDRNFEEMTDANLLDADLVMVSAMHVQRVDARAVLARARALGRRTFIGGPWASSEPEVVLLDADHALAGEAEEVFPEIATDLENGSARRLYRISEKPDLSKSPIPRFDLLRLDHYLSMPVQFSRGCPFQCEFCDIITIYGRKPRTKTSAQVVAELERLLELGWRNEVFIVDDNFIGNGRQALQLARDLKSWQETRRYPFTFYTEASVDLADRPELLAAMVAANFMSVFLGIETPSEEALKETRKFQNLRRDTAERVRTIQESGLWVLGGFIVGFDSDDETIFQRQIEFINGTGIAWAMVGCLQAPPTTPLYERMRRQGRLIEDMEMDSNFSPPNFRTMMPRATLLRGLSQLLETLYEPRSYFDRAFRSIQLLKPRASQHPPELAITYSLLVFLSSVWTQGLRSTYRIAYWQFLGRMARHWLRDRVRLSFGFAVLLSAHHFLHYTHQASRQLQAACEKQMDPMTGAQS